MTTHTQPSDRPRLTTPPAADRPTRGLHHDDGLVVDPIALLDHRTRERTLSPSQASAGRYLAVEHAGGIRLIPLDTPIVHIGRGLVADVRIEDPQVSRRQAILAMHQDGEHVSLLDDRSSNGTYVNGRRIVAQILRDGDVVRVGRAVFRFVEVAERRPPQPLRRVPLAALRHSVREGRRSGGRGRAPAELPVSGSERGAGGGGEAGGGGRAA